MQNAIGAAIRSARRQRGWTQAQLHVRSNVNLGDISRVEAGRLVPTRTQLKRLADALQLPRTQLLDREDGDAV